MTQYALFATRSEARAAIDTLNSADRYGWRANPQEYGRAGGMFMVVGHRKSAISERVLGTDGQMYRFDEIADPTVCESRAVPSAFRGCILPRGHADVHRASYGPNAITWSI